MIKNSLNRFLIFGMSCLLVGALMLSACSGRQHKTPSNGDGVPASASNPAASSQPNVVDDPLFIDEIFFNSLVDTVSCHYLSAYAKKYIKDSELICEFEKYLSKEAIVNSIEKINKDNSSNWNNVRSNMKVLWNSIESKRNKYSDTATIDELIEYLIEVPQGCGFPSDLANAKNSLNEKLKYYLYSKSIEIENSDGQPTEQEDEFNSETKNGKCKFCGKELTKSGKEFCNKSCKRKYQEPRNNGVSDSKPWLYFLFGFLFGIALMGFVMKIHDKKEKNHLSEQSRFNEELLKGKRELQRQLKQLQEKNEHLLNENINLGKELDIYKSEKHVKDYNYSRNEEGNQSVPQIQVQKDPKVLYADAIVDGSLMRVREVEGDDSVFELHLNTPDTADFVICARANQRIVANPSFIEGCEKQVLPNATNIEIVAPGKAHKDPSNGKWVVTEKLKVNIR